MVMCEVCRLCYPGISLAWWVVGSGRGGRHACRLTLTSDLDIEIAAGDNPPGAVTISAGADDIDIDARHIDAGAGNIHTDVHIDARGGRQSYR